MKTYCSILFVLAFTLSFAQEEIPVQEFSNQYRGAFVVKEHYGTNVGGDLRITDKTTGVELIEVWVASIAYELDGAGKIKLRKENSESDFVIYRDFNNDGLEDIAIRTREENKGANVNSLYSVFLKRGDTFVYNREASLHIYNIITSNFIEENKSQGASEKWIKMEEDGIDVNGEKILFGNSVFAFYLNRFANRKIDLIIQNNKLYFVDYNTDDLSVNYFYDDNFLYLAYDDELSFIEGENIYKIYYAPEEKGIKIKNIEINAKTGSRKETMQTFKILEESETGDFKSIVNSNVSNLKVVEDNVEI